MDTLKIIEARGVTPSSLNHRMVRVGDVNPHAVVGGAPLLVLNSRLSADMVYLRMLPLPAANHMSGVRRS